ncbi:MAG: hypothetical protein UT05_C0006G0030 [Parcubacteria group bacterium GW2011_GWF2_38_76]|nr:MAG: hypothetical protein UT05_C0006G0030 [Parcubacteria group bacterium GW2011_GWF2_38_76]HBM45870.1 hypothetical protein [Patescibacteria group bacterium]
MARNISREELIKRAKENLCLIEKRLDELDFLIRELDNVISCKIRSSHEYSDPEINTFRDSRDMLFRKKKLLLRKKENTEIFIKKQEELP